MISASWLREKVGRLLSLKDPPQAIAVGMFFRINPALGPEDAACARSDTTAPRQHRGGGHRRDVARRYSACDAVAASLGIRRGLLALEPSTCPATEAAYVSPEPRDLFPLVHVFHRRPAFAAWFVGTGGPGGCRDVLCHACTSQTVETQAKFVARNV